MIGRLWFARTETGSAANAYADVFRTEVLGELGALPGFHGAYLLRRTTGAGTGTGTELAALTLFDSLDAVRGFAGPDADRANVSAPARALLSDFDATVRNFSVVVAT